MLLESEVQDLAEDHPDQAHVLMDQLTQPLQLYQNAAQMAEQRTAFLSKVKPEPRELQCLKNAPLAARAYVSPARIFSASLSDPHLSSGV